VVVFTKSQTGVAVAAARAPVLASPAVADPPRARRWPMFVCAFVAGLAGGVAFIVSPVGHRREVRQVTSSAVEATIALVSSLR
jgi:hypothetical protein